MLSAAVDRLSANTDDWTLGRLLDEGLDLARDAVWADGAALYAVDENGATAVCRRPRATTPRPDVVAAAWFPWGLGPVNPTRFLLVQDAESLPTGPGRAPTLGELGIRSCLHLPLLDRQHPIGSLQLFWREPRLVWDDDAGRVLRSLGQYLLSRRRSARDGRAFSSLGSAPTDPRRH